jgi:transposase
MGRRRTYTAEFKREAVGLTRDPDRTIAEVARSQGIDRSVLRAWKIRMDADGDEGFPGHGCLKASDEKVAQFRREFERTRQERDIQKRALQGFVWVASPDLGWRSRPPQWK